ncbi:MAG: DUF1800 domain-containing protein [Verrucomicrobiales bacterium]|nr:DUF1800 domain-containing protein [Verrucomicrobiales bacterium]
MNSSPQSRRVFLQLASGSGMLALTACDGVKDLAGTFLRFGPKAPALAPFAVPQETVPDLVTHALNRLTWGVAPGEYGRVRSLGETPAAAVAAFIEEQLNPARIEDREVSAALSVLEAMNVPMGELFEYKPAQLDDELTRNAVLRAVYSRRQLHEVMCGFWSDHFNIDSSKLECRWVKTVDDREVIRKHALGNFRDLLRASALSPAMLVYLDGRQNKKRKPADKPNENYARELLELHTLGVHGGYTQNDVREAARCLTGWSVKFSARMGEALGRLMRPGAIFDAGSPAGNAAIGQAYFDPKAHDAGEKTVLGTRIPSSGAGELDALLDLVARHPSTATFLAGKLCRHFIADDPPVPAVQAVASAFVSSHGDIRTTLRRLFATPEFLSQRSTRIKRPFHFVVSALRATGASTQCGPGIKRSLRIMGQAPFHYPTPEGPPPEGAAWLSTLLYRWEFATRLAGQAITCSKLEPEKLTACAGGVDGLLAHLFGRRPTAEESAAAAVVANPAALALAAPGFQCY